MKIAVFSDNKEVNHLFLSDLEQGNLLYLDFQKDNNSSKIYLKKSFWSSEVSINESLSKNQITTLISFKSSFPKLKKEDAAIQKVLYFLPRALSLWHFAYSQTESSCRMSLLFYSMGSAI